MLDDGCSQPCDALLLIFQFHRCRLERHFRIGGKTARYRSKANIQLTENGRLRLLVRPESGP